MEGLPSGDIQAKYQKLASEYSKLRVHVKVLKKGVLDEQAKSNELRVTLKEREKSLRKSELEIDSLTFRNQQLTRRVSVLQDELEAVQQKSSKKGKNKKEEKGEPSSTMAPLDSGLLQEELQKKIIENAHFSSQLADKVFEISQLRSSLEDYQQQLADSEARRRAEEARLRHKAHELRFTLEEVQKERARATGAGTCNGDLLSEGGSLMGSEDALSSVDDAPAADAGPRLQALEQENERLCMELGVARLEVARLRHAAGAGAGGGAGDGGDAAGEGEAPGRAQPQPDGRCTGLLGSLWAPAGAAAGAAAAEAAAEAAAREARVTEYYRGRLARAAAERCRAVATSEHYIKECEQLRTRHELQAAERRSLDAALAARAADVAAAEDELQSTAANYSQQLSVLSEHVALLHDQLAEQHETIDQLRRPAAPRR